MNESPLRITQEGAKPGSGGVWGPRRSRPIATAWLVVAMASMVTQVVAPPVVYAEDAFLRAAKRRAAKGKKLFELGRFEEALDEYQAAYDAKPTAGIMYMIGQCHRNLGNWDQAVFSFTKYLDLDPAAADRGLVEDLIKELEDRKARDDAAKYVAPSGGTPAASGTPIYKKWWFWTGLVVVAGAGTGAYFATRGPSLPETTLGNIPVNP